MIKTKKIDNSFTIKENKTDNPKIKNEDLEKKPFLYKNNIKNVPTKTVNEPEPKLNKESFGNEVKICPLPPPLNNQCVRWTPPTWDEFMAHIGMDNLVSDLQTFWEDEVEVGLNETVNIFNDVWSEIQKIWGRLDPIANILELISLFLHPIFQVLIAAFKIIFDAISPLMNSYFGAGAGIYFLYFYLFPSLFLISGVLSMSNALMGIINQIRGVEF
tara:strand:+ start:1695 stop:2342 length:648 start_codon:yes stop_codon:yes gene_type:complete